MALHRCQAPGCETLIAIDKPLCGVHYRQAERSKKPKTIANQIRESRQTRRELEQGERLGRRAGWS